MTDPITPALDDHREQGGSPALWACFILLILLGVVVRVAQFAYGRSLWMDELLLVANLKQRGFAGLFEPLDYGQFAPIGFLMLSKASVELFGDSEQAYRLVALLSSIGSLLLFALLIKRVASPRGCLIGVGFFACLPRLIYYANEFKQYSTDLFAVTAVLLLVLWLWRRESSPTRWAVLGLVGLVLSWFSHPMIFALGGAAVVITIDLAWRRQWVLAGAGTVLGLLWAGQFVALYLLFYNYGSESEALNTYWAGHFMPRPIASFTTVKWLIDAMYQVIPTEPGKGGGAGLQIDRFSGLLAVLMVLGCIGLLRRGPRVLALLLLPLGFLLLAAGVQAYPIYSRLVLFAATITLVLAGAGGGMIADAIAKTNRPLAHGFLIVVLILPTLFAAHKTLKPVIYQEAEQILQILAEKRTPEQAIFVTGGSVGAFKYYREKAGISEAGVVYPQKTAPDVLSIVYGQVDQIAALPEVWVIAFHGHSMQGVSDVSLMELELDRRGEKLDQIIIDRSTATLYRFESAERESTTQGSSG